MTYSSTITITTKNRKDDLQKAVASAVRQTVPVEVVVIDDGSSDGTSELVRREFPEVKLRRFEESQGLITQRNRAAKLAAGSIVFSIDDDAVFSSPRVVERTLGDFDHPRIGAVAIPFVDVRRGKNVLQRASDLARTEVTDCFQGTAFAVRRALFLALGGFRASLVHQGEERDFCLRLLNAGYVVRLGRADAIQHFESPRRDFHRMDFYGRRNDILFAWHNVPSTRALPHILATTVRGLCCGVQVGRPWKMLWGLTCGYCACLSQWSGRRPVVCKVYRLHRRLKKCGPWLLQDIESALPPMLPVENGDS